MTKSFSLDLTTCKLDNDLWPKFVERIGLDKSRIAFRQSLDLQHMWGDSSTLPLLIFETCGSALISIDVLRTHTGLLPTGTTNVIIYSSKLLSWQLLLGS